MECKICYEIFDNEMFIPKIMSNCGHSFCKICMERITDGKSTIQCPICREKTRLIRKNDRIPVNYALLEVLSKEDQNREARNILEKYKYFDSKSVAGVPEALHRTSSPHVLNLRKIVNDDFIYLEHLDNTQNRSVFSTFTKRNRRYNFNKNSIYRFLFDEYSYSISLFRKSSKCRHTFSCSEHLIRNTLTYFTICFLLKFPLKTSLSHFYKYSEDESSLLSIAVSMGIASVLSVSKLFNCLVAYYLDQLLSIK